MATRKDFECFDCDNLVKQLSSMLPGEVSSETLDELKRHRVTGRSFLELNDEELREVTSLLGERKALKRVIVYYTTGDSTSNQSLSTSTCSVSIYQYVQYTTTISSFRFDIASR